MPVQPPSPHPGDDQTLTLPSTFFFTDAIPFTDFKTVNWFCLILILFSEKIQISTIL